jgi:hypothetical protein
MSTELSTPWVAQTLEELIAGATDRVEVRSSDAKSGAHFERLVIDGRRCFLKLTSGTDDWLMRVSGNTSNWEFKVWRAGLYAQTPSVIDHTIIGMALEGTGPTARLSILMNDCGTDLVPSGDTILPPAHHAAFIDHMAAMHAHFMGWRDHLGLQDLAQRFRYFAPDNIAAELRADDVPEPLAVADRGWAVLPERAPRLHELAAAGQRDAEGLAEALRTTPLTFVAGDWKLGNVGRHADGRTVLLDWAYPGESAPTWDLTWYLAINRARLPESKESTIDRYRKSLEQHGVDTTGWWERQLGLSLLGMAAVFAWEKAVGDQDELDWWEQAAVAGARFL